MPPWKFTLPVDDDARQPILDAIDRWWTAFAGKLDDLEGYIRRQQSWDLPGWMTEHLGAIHPRLMWEFGPGLAGGRRLVITPENRRYLRPLAEVVLARAPRLAGWSFHGHRLPEVLADAIAVVEARTSRNLADTAVAAQMGEDQRIDLYYQSPRFEQGNSDDLEEAFVATEALLGEETLQRWIGYLEVGPPEADRHALPLDRLRDTVAALVDSRIEQLPDRPCWHIEPAGYAAIEITSEPGIEDIGWSDLISASTGFVDLWQALHGDENFDSCRYSRHGERFAYLKIDASAGLAPEQRGVLEDDIDQALKPAGLGCVVGGGSGARFSYIDLALTDVAKAAGVLRELLQANQAPRRAWLLFFDREWEAEYVSMWDDSPPPPLPDFDAG